MNRFFMVCIVLIFILMLGDSVFAATITGSVYDFSFSKVENAIVSIDTKPRQQIVAVEGDYNFEVPVGSYTIYAKKDNLYAEENTTVRQDGTFTLDLILLPDFKDEEELSDDLDETAIEDDFDIEQKNDIYLYIIGILTIIVSFAIFMFKKSIRKRLSDIISPKKGPEANVNSAKEEGFEKRGDVAYLDEPENAKYRAMILEYLGSVGGHGTQKDIRKHIPISEAKISLILTELEHEGHIRKYKKGRGNVIVLR